LSGARLAFALAVLLGSALGVMPRAGCAAEEAPRVLPPVVTICRDRTSGDCWVVPGEAPCRDEKRPEASVFRVVLAGPGRDDAEVALAQCRALRTTGAASAGCG